MPHTTAEYSACLEEAFDRRGFALALHADAAPLLGAAPEAFKTRFSRIDDGVIGDGAAHHAMIHVEVAILADHDADTKQSVASLALHLAEKHLQPPAGLVVQATVDIRGLDAAAYRKHTHDGRAERTA